MSQSMFLRNKSKSRRLTQNFFPTNVEAMPESHTHPIKLELCVSSMFELGCLLVLWQNLSIPKPVIVHWQKTLFALKLP